jgi:hypothetical protein
VQPSSQRNAADAPHAVVSGATAWHWLRDEIRATTAVAPPRSEDSRAALNATNPVALSAHFAICAPMRWPQAARKTRTARTILQRLPSVAAPWVQSGSTRYHWACRSIRCTHTGERCLSCQRAMRPKCPRVRVDGPRIAFPEVGGLHHRYERPARRTATVNRRLDFDVLLRVCGERPCVSVPRFRF